MSMFGTSTATPLPAKSERSRVPLGVTWVYTGIDIFEVRS